MSTTTLPNLVIQRARDFYVNMFPEEERAKARIEFMSKVTVEHTGLPPGKDVVLIPMKKEDKASNKIVVMVHGQGRGNCSETAATAYDMWLKTNSANSTKAVRKKAAEPSVDPDDYDFFIVGPLSEKDDDLDDEENYLQTDDYDKACNFALFSLNGDAFIDGVIGKDGDGRVRLDTYAATDYSQYEIYRHLATGQTLLIATISSDFESALERASLEYKKTGLTIRVAGILADGTTEDLAFYNTRTGEEE